ncbi:HAMP domain-containing protein [Parasulfuritortus cantonensis]|uniref:histidine kinase n=1 Tax=Parasulfuritortus cantonensis TaxID=2528202 RepID=A0A4R1BFJ9_9PROT|nr:ATP-binding protein [Parasulfuritortus cantonensis]TCJ15818.1 HAMP domain-containing protein [Parasulfuritortus cantonensis]
MKRLDTIYLRVAGILLLGLLAAQWIAERLYQEERERVLSMQIAAPLVTRLASVAETLDHTAAAGREGLLPVLSTPRITFSLVGRSVGGSEQGALGKLQKYLRKYLGEERDVHVAGGPDETVAGIPIATHITFRLHDGQVVQAIHHYPKDNGVEPSRHLPLLAGYFIAIAVLALVAMRWAVQPLRRLAQAADALGRNLGGPPLPETGPRELRQAAHAFNTMQRRLASYLDDRLRILAAVSHDLKTPITRLKLRAEMLPDDAQRAKFVRDLEDMETMLAATLDFLRGESRQEAGAPLDVNALLSTLQDDMASVGQEVVVEGEALQPIQARPQALKRCLANLIENAVRYGGNCRVRVEDGAQELRLRIDDDGPGIPDENLELMFQPFRRGENSRNRETGGVGLGLAIARNLARAHGGDVTMANRPEGGLRVTVTLPRGV